VLTRKDILDNLTDEIMQLKKEDLLVREILHTALSCAFTELQIIVTESLLESAQKTIRELSQNWIEDLKAFPKVQK
jgi:hypothetical protein